MLRFTVNGYTFFMFLRIAHCGSSCFSFISCNIKEVMIDVDKCFGIGRMFTRLLVRCFKRT